MIYRAINNWNKILVLLLGLLIFILLSTKTSYSGYVLNNSLTPSHSSTSVIKWSKFGYYMLGIENDMVTRDLFNSGGEFEDLNTWIKSIGYDGTSYLLDIGCNIGSLSLFASKLGWKVICVEMQQDLSENLMFIKNLNHFSDLTVLNRALDETSNGYVSYELNNDNRGGTGPTKSNHGTKTISLDELMSGKTVSAIKIDIEGQEDKLLNRKNMDLLKNVRHMHIELRANQLKLLKLLDDHGFNLMTKYCKGCESTKTLIGIKAITEQLQSKTVGDCYCNVLVENY